MSEVTLDKMDQEPQAAPVHLEAPAFWLRRGWQDFMAAPGVSLIYGAIFVLAGFAIVSGLNKVGLSHLILPVSGGFLLFAPFLALGLYEVSRQLELGQHPTFLTTWLVWKRSPRRLGIMAFVSLLYMLVWLRLAMVLYALMLGNASHNLENLFWDIFTTNQGLLFLAVGSAIGLAFAAIAFLFTAVSVPMIMDRDTGAFTAMMKSAQVVTQNRHVMWSWAFTIAIISWFAISVFFVGLIVAMPVLAYASWHAYRDLVHNEH